VSTLAAKTGASGDGHNCGRWSSTASNHWRASQGGARTNAVIGAPALKLPPAGADRRGGQMHSQARDESELRRRARAKVRSCEKTSRQLARTDYGTLLWDHVTLWCRSLNRIFLQAYVPRLQAVGSARFFAGSGSPRLPLPPRSAKSALGMSRPSTAWPKQILFRGCTSKRESRKRRRRALIWKLRRGKARTG
jgi:hypothetical protein